MADTFPLTPSWGYEEVPIDRQVRVRMESGKLYVRSRGTDIWSAEITGVGSPSEITTLKNFHANHVKDTFTFEDKTQSPTINRTCVFLSNLRVNYLGNARYEWRCLIAETTTA